MNRLMIFNCLGTAVVCVVLCMVVFSNEAVTGLVPCVKHVGEVCERRRECNKCKICTSSDQCCCRHFDRCTCDIAETKEACCK